MYLVYAHKQLVESNDLDCGLVTKAINFEFICLQNSRDELISTLEMAQYIEQKLETSNKSACERADRENKISNIVDLHMENQ